MPLAQALGCLDASRIPGFGTKTLESMIYAGATGIVIEAGNTLIAEREKVIELADKHNITILVR